MRKIWSKKIIDIYLIKQVLYPFLIGIIIITIIGISNFLFQMTDMIIVKNIPVSTVLELLFYRMPEVIVNTFPIAILFAVITGLGRICRQNEFTALRMGGVSIYRLIIPLLLIGIVVSLTTFILNENVVPWSIHEAQNIIRENLLRDVMPSIQENVFFEGPEGRVFYVKEYQEEEGLLNNIIIFNKANRREEYPEVITANEGIVEQNKWLLKEGIIHKYNENSGLAYEIQFGSREIDLGEEMVNFSGKQKTTSEMTRKELKKNIDLFERSGMDVTSYLIDYYIKLSQPFTALIFILIGTPLSLAQKDNRVLSIILTIAIVFLYYLTFSLMRSFAQNYFLSPFLAAWLPNIIFTILGMILLIWRESWRSMLMRLIPFFLIVFIFLLPSNTSNVQAAGDSIMFQSEAYYYDKKTNTVVISGLKQAQYDKFYIQADEIEIIGDDKGQNHNIVNPEKITIPEGSFSGCSNDKPHYKFTASKIVIYPDDHLAAYNVVFWEFNGRVPFLYWPYLYIPLKDERKFVSEFGYSTSRGWFLKNTYFYNLNNLPGELYLDYFTKTKFAGGFKQHFVHKNNEEGYINLYGQQNKINLAGLYEWEGEFSYNKDFGNWTADTLARYTRYDNYSYLSGRANLKNDVEDQTVNFSSNFNIRDYDEEEIDDIQRLKIDFGYNKSFKNNLDLALDIEKDLNYTQSEKDQEKNTFSFDMDYNPAENWKLHMDYEYQDLLKPDENKQDRWEGEVSAAYFYDDFEYKLLWQRDDPRFDEEDNVSFYRAPEMNIFYTPSGNFDYEVSAGRYYEDISGIDGYRGGAGVSYNNYWNLTKKTTLSSTQSLSGYIYDEGRGAQTFLNNRLRLQNKLTDNLTFTNTYNSLDQWGYTPFYFDKKSPSKKIDSDLRYRKKKIDLNLSSGYNIEREKYMPFVFSLNLYPLPDWTMRFRTTYDFNELKYTDDLSFSNIVKRENFNVETSLQYNMENERFSVVNNRLKYEVPGEWGWSLENNISYDFERIAEERLRTANVLLKKNLHCREISLGYNYLDNEVVFTYRINLFPEKSLSVGRSDTDPFKIGIGMDDGQTIEF